jgi:hypothetical protein
VFGVSLATVTSEPTPDGNSAITNPAELLEALEVGEVNRRLDDDTEALVARALERCDRRELRAASLALRVHERAARDDGQPIPERVAHLLRRVRDAMHDTK